MLASLSQVPGDDCPGAQETILTNGRPLNTLAEALMPSQATRTAILKEHHLGELVQCKFIELCCTGSQYISDHDE